MKRKIADFLVWLLHKLAPYHMELTKQYLGKEEITIGFGKWLPRDGQWHHVSMNFSCWMIAGKPEVNRSDTHLQTFIDGALITDHTTDKA